MTDRKTGDGGVRRRRGRAGKDRLRPVTRREMITLVAIMAGFSALGLVLIAKGAPLGHDESVYALRSRFYAYGDVRGGYWADYRAVGLPLVMTPMWLVSGTEPYLRGVVLGVGTVGIALTWGWTRLLFGPVPALLAAILLAVTPSYLNWSWQITPDVPGMALSLAAVLLLAWAARGERLSLLALGVVPLVAMATAMRYGAPIILAAGLAGVGLANWRAVRARVSLAAVTALGSLASVFAVLLVPAVTGSQGSPWKAVQARQAAKDVPWWDSVTDLVGVLPSVAGPVGGVVVAGGLVVCGLLAWDRRLPTRPVVLNLGILAAFLVLLNVSLGHGEGRYLIPAFPFVLACAGAGLTAVGRDLPRVALVVLVTALLLGGGFVGYGLGADSVASLDRFGPLRQASRELGARFGPDCAVLTSYSPQVSWYSGCAARAMPHREPENVDRFWRRLEETLNTGFDGVASDAQLATLLVSQGKRQPQDRALRAFESLFEDTVVETGRPGTGRLGYVRVISLGRLEALQESLSSRVPKPDYQTDGGGTVVYRGVSEGLPVLIHTATSRSHVRKHRPPPSGSPLGGLRHSPATARE